MVEVSVTVRLAPGSGGGCTGMRMLGYGHTVHPFGSSFRFQAALRQVGWCRAGTAATFPGRIPYESNIADVRPFAISSCECAMQSLFRFVSAGLAVVDPKSPRFNPLRDKNICSILGAESLPAPPKEGTMSQASFALPHDRGNPGSIACISVPHFALRVALLERPELDGEPLVLGPLPGTRANVSDATPEAQSRGIRPGMSVREAIALCPEAVILSPNPVREAAVADHSWPSWSNSARWSRPTRPSPAPGTSICAAWSATSARRPRRRPLLATLPPVLRPRAGVGAGKFTARVAAGTRPARRALRRRRGADRRLPLPGAGRAGCRCRRRHPPLEALGLHTLGELSALPAAKVAARFGPTGRHIWDLARGNDPEPVRPREPRPIVTEWMDLPAPATSRENLPAGPGPTGRTRLPPACPARPGGPPGPAAARLEGGSSWEKALTLRAPYAAADLIRALGYAWRTWSCRDRPNRSRSIWPGLHAETGTQERLPGYRTRWTTPLIEATRHLKQRYGTPPLPDHRGRAMVADPGAPARPDRLRPMNGPRPAASGQSNALRFLNQPRPCGPDGAARRHPGPPGRPPSGRTDTSHRTTGGHLADRRRMVAATHLPPLLPVGPDRRPAPDRLPRLRRRRLVCAGVLRETALTP